ncbi:MAG: DNA polymerase III subunit gamma/tau [Chloroflexi bacterium]|nr:DNA polymerase III subunit gamma/tau [Chloroflexota bacterium]
MASQALYRRWRPQTYDDVIGQEHVTRTLQNALEAGRIAHAYLFAGPRGTGKTSVARILAKAVNCTGTGTRPCNSCLICRSFGEGRSLDLIEIDAASNRGIDEIRDLREKVNFSPSEGRYKVYIVDEVHMLTNEAFNALLKTLEEPPAHAIFVLATTEAHRIPATVLSRCQRFDFKRIPTGQVIEQLAAITHEEGLEIDPGALDLIARQATGSLRDALSLTDQLIAYAGDRITLQQVQSVLGTVSASAVAELIDYLIADDSAAGLRLINQVVDEGLDPRQFARQILEHLRYLLLARNGSSEVLDLPQDSLEILSRQAGRITSRRLIDVIKLFNEAAYSMRGQTQVQLPLEVAFVEATLGQEEQALVSYPAASAAPPAAPKPSTTAAPEQSVAPGRVASPGKSASAGPEENSKSPAPAPPAARQSLDGARIKENPAPEKAAAAGEIVLSEQPPVTLVSPAPDKQEAELLTLDTVRLNWSAFLQAVKNHNPTLEALLKDSEPVDVAPDGVTVGFYYEFHRNKADEQKHRTVMEDCLRQVLRQPALRLQCILTTRRANAVDNAPRNKYEAAAQDPLIKAALHMGGQIADIRQEAGIRPEDESRKE